MAPFEVQILKQLDPFLGEVAVLPLVSETVLRPLGLDPRPEGLVVGVVLGDQAVVVLVLVYVKLVVAVVPGSLLLHFGFPHFEKNRKRTLLFQFTQNLQQPPPPPWLYKRHTFH